MANQDEAFPLPRAAGRRRSSRAAGWNEARAAVPRRKSHLVLLAFFALLAVLVVLGLFRMVASVPTIDARWYTNEQGRIALISSTQPALQAYAGEVLVGVMGVPAAAQSGAIPAAGSSTTGVLVNADPIALRRSPRWIINDRDRARQQAVQAQLNAAFEEPAVRFVFADGGEVELRPAPRAALSLPAALWLLCAASLMLFLTALHMVLERLGPRNLLYAVMAWCQAGNLLLIGAEMSFEFGLRGPLAHGGMLLHVACDLITAAAMVTASTLHPMRLPRWRWISFGAWSCAIALIALLAADALPAVWWWTQGVVLAMGFLIIGLFTWSYRIEPHPLAVALRQLGLITTGTWGLMTLALAGSDGLSSVPHYVADIVAVVWYAYLAAVLLLVPFLARAQNLMREFALLAAVSTIAISLYLLFVAVFSLGQLPALTLVLFVSLGVYSIVRQWILSQVFGSNVLTTERVFEQLYRIAREVERRPERAPALLSQLLRDVFEPLEVAVSEMRPSSTQLATDAASMLVPLPMLGGDDPFEARSVLIRFAQRGRRLFNTEDVRLTDRIIEQLRRVVQFDKAVEQGRHEERLRLAQDLHDDIGARLLTLMYKAQSPEMEDYVRHTLQDLKTLTRGLAASNHRLSHAAAEWKADLSHRLKAAHIELMWTFEFDDDIRLTVVHWSALTRIMRELVSNAIAHAKAQQLQVDFRLEGDRIELFITDDGVGHDPRAWLHGLGLGGVRKRVKQLGGEVEWREVRPHGISCRVIIRDVSVRWQA